MGGKSSKKTIIPLKQPKNFENTKSYDALVRSNSKRNLKRVQDLDVTPPQSPRETHGQLHRELNMIVEKKKKEMSFQWNFKTFTNNTEIQKIDINKAQHYLRKHKREPRIPIKVDQKFPPKKNSMNYTDPKAKEIKKEIFVGEDIDSSEIFEISTNRDKHMKSNATLKKLAHTYTLPINRKRGKKKKEDSRSIENDESEAQAKSIVPVVKRQPPALIPLNIQVESDILQNQRSLKSALAKNWLRSNSPMTSMIQSKDLAKSISPVVVALRSTKSKTRTIPAFIIRPDISVSPNMPSTPVKKQSPPRSKESSPTPAQKHNGLNISSINKSGASTPILPKGYNNNLSRKYKWKGSHGYIVDWEIILIKLIIFE
ncbi:unnamed protein product [Blepharisma stoltei]|uniref:Uncharacterized protein n=1 Tax=Blepharisma stoltei TaxID=1481888 RepID=A0AAU9K781_9CILI|nr:unnamed protein product [Blepharisma stoltei]